MIVALHIFSTPLVAATSGPYTYAVSNGKAIITAFDSSYSGSLIITDNLGGCPVTTIGEGAFSDCYGMTAATIPNTITNIGSSAFSSCTSLESVIIGTNVTTIGSGAFSGCTHLTSVTLPESVNTLGAGAFYQCTGLTNISVETENPYYSDIEGILCNKDQTTIIAFPGGRTPGSYITPDGITAIADAAFADCTGLTSIVFSDNVQTIGVSAFTYCTSLTNAIIGKGVASIGSGAFFNTTRLSSVYYNATNCAPATTGGRDPYYLTYIFGKTVNNSCGIHVTIGKDVKQIPDHLFEALEIDAVGLLIFDTDGTTLSYNGKIASVVFEQPSSCTAIGTRAFAYNPGLRTVNIPASVQEIGEFAFWGCANLTSMTLPGNIRPEGANYLQSVTILEGSTSIAESAFEKGIPSVDYMGQGLFDYDGQPLQTAFSYLTTVTIPESVTSIGPKAFMDCASLSSITIPSRVTSIGYSAFSGCFALSSLRLLDSPATIQSSAFMYCINLSSVILGDKVEVIESSAFDNCSKISSILIPSSTKQIASCAFSSCGSLTTVTIPDTVSSVADYAFFNCPAIRTVALPSSILPLRRIFSDYQRITSVTVGQSSTNIPDYAFADCTSLTSVTLPAQIQTIGYAAFFNCSSLQAISLPSSVVSLGDWSFSCCSSLESISLPLSLRLIGARAFSYCDSLISITIPEAVTHIADWAFAWSPNLTSVTYAGNAPTVGTDIYSAPFSDVTTHVMPWATGWGSSFAERPVERYSAQLYAPSITPPDGYVFQSNTFIIIRGPALIIGSLSNTYPAAIRYTRDGSEPTPTSPIYSRFSVTNDTIIKARFFGDNNMFSEVATVRLFTGTYNGAMDLPHALNFNAPPTISSNVGWFAQTRITYDGQAAAQSPLMYDNEESMFTIPLTGPGQVSFQWKTSCEKDDTGAMNWDYASVMVDGVEISRQDGETDWLPVSFEIPEGTHEISIIYRKDEMFSSGEDCVWVDNFAFMPSSPLMFSLRGESFEVAVSTNFTLNATQSIINSAIGTYSGAFPDSTPDDVRTVLSTADAMGLSIGLLAQGTNILLFTPTMYISNIQLSNSGTPPLDSPNQFALSFTLENGITTSLEAANLLENSSSRRLEILAMSQLNETITTIIPISTNFSNGTVTITFQLLTPPSEAFFRIRLINQAEAL